MRISLILAVLCLPAHAWSAELTVTPNPAQAGEFSTVAEALGAATDGDAIVILAGTYDEDGLETRAPNVTVRAQVPGAVVITNDGRVLRVKHPGITLDGLILDGRFGDGDVLQVRDEGSGFILRNSEVRNSGRDCVDMGAPTDVLIEDSEIHHCLASSQAGCTAAECRTDAHAIVHGAAQRVILRNVVAHTFSGDAWQADPGRQGPGWTDVVIEGCTFWTAPLAEPAGGFGAGINPAENAVDTKVWNDAPEPARLTIRDTVAYGFRGGVIGNMAAFNLKENVLVLVDGVTVFDSEIAFRLRGETGSRPVGAQVTLRNIVVEDVDTAIRYEDDIQPITIEHATFGTDIGRVFQAASVPRPASEILRCLNSLSISEVADCPIESGFVTGAAAGWLDAQYLPLDGSPAIDAGVDLAHVTTDRLGNPRPSGAGWDLGAYEYPSTPDPDPDPDPDPEPEPEPDPDPLPDPTPDDSPDEASEPTPRAASSEGGCSTGHVARPDPPSRWPLQGLMRR